MNGGRKSYPPVEIFWLKIKILETGGWVNSTDPLMIRV
nr:MAG TPA: hypothetical protein [Caudoviricetes sp.]